MHAFEYAILGLLLARSILSMNSRSSDRYLVVLVVALATLYGISDEIHQGFVSGRIASPWDVVADGVGAFIGTFCYVYVKPNF